MFSDCPYRQQTDAGLICGLAKNILKTDNNTLYVINDDVCKLCYNTKEIPDEKKLNDLVADILEIAAKKTIENNVDVERANKLIVYINQKLIDRNPINKELLTKHLSQPKQPCNCGQQKQIERKIGNVR